MTLSGRRSLSCLVVLASLLGPAATSTGESTPALTVFGAADLAFAFQEIVPRFERATGARVTLVLGSTGQLAKQIESGAPADVFFAANRSFVDDLVTRGGALAATGSVYAQGRLVLATARRSGPKLTGLRGLLDPRVRRVAIANPLHAPYGKAAEEALRSAGLWDAVQPKLVYGENIRQTLQFLQTGAVEAGIVSLSIASVPEVDWILLDAALHRALDQAVAVVSRSARPELALAFIQFVNGPEGRPIMKRYGFALAGEF